MAANEITLNKVLGGLLMVLGLSMFIPFMGVLLVGFLKTIAGIVAIVAGYVLFTK